MYDKTGNVIGMKLRVQRNWQVKPTDVYYPSLWQPAANSSLASNGGEDGIYVPVTWIDVSFRAPRKTLEKINAKIQVITSLMVMFYFGIPFVCLVVGGFAAVRLYIRGKIAKDRARIVDEIRSAEADRSPVAKTGASMINVNSNVLPNQFTSPTSSAAARDVVVGDPAADVSEEEYRAATIRSKFWDTSAAAAAEEGDAEDDAETGAGPTDRVISTVIVNVAPATTRP